MRYKTNCYVKGTAAGAVVPGLAGFTCFSGLFSSFGTLAAPILLMDSIYLHGSISDVSQALATVFIGLPAMWIGTVALGLSTILCIDTAEKNWFHADEKIENNIKKNSKFLEEQIAFLEGLENHSPKNGKEEL